MGFTKHLLILKKAQMDSNDDRHHIFKIHETAFHHAP